MTKLKHADQFTCSLALQDLHLSLLVIFSMTWYCIQHANSYTSYELNEYANSNYSPLIHNWPGMRLG